MLQRTAPFVLIPVAAAVLGLIGCATTSSSGSSSSKQVAPPEPEPAETAPADPGSEGAEDDVPAVVLTSMNINPDPEAGPGGSALYILDGCEGEGVGCAAGTDEGLLDEPERLTWTAERDGTILLVIDAFGAGGDYRLDVAVADRNR